MTQAFSVELLDEKMPALLANQNAVWFPFATHKGLETQVDGWLNKVRGLYAVGRNARKASTICASCLMKCV